MKLKETISEQGEVKQMNKKYYLMKMDDKGNWSIVKEKCLQEDRKTGSSDNYLRIHHLLTLAWMRDPAGYYRIDEF